MDVECRAMHSDCAPPASQKLRYIFYIYNKETGVVLHRWSRRQQHQFLVGKQFEIAVIQEEKSMVDGFCTHLFYLKVNGQSTLILWPEEKLCHSHESEALGPWHDCAQSTFTQYFIQHGICSLHFHSGILCSLNKTKTKTKQSRIKCSS